MPAARASRGVLGQMQGLAMHRNQQLRPGPADKVAQLLTPRMAGDMHEMGASVTTSMPARQPWTIRAHRLLIAGNGPGGEDHGVALVQGHIGCSPRAILAIAARASPWLPVQERQDLVGGKLAEKIRAAEGRQALEIAGFARDLRNAVHGRPTATTSRPASFAASATAMMRPTLEAKVVTATRPWRSL